MTEARRMVLVGLSLSLWPVMALLLASTLSGLGPVADRIAGGLSLAAYFLGFLSLVFGLAFFVVGLFLVWRRRRAAHNT